MLVMLLHATASQAQVTTGGEVAGGYMWRSSDIPDSRLHHTEGKGTLWFGYKAKSLDWRLSLTGKYKDLDSETKTNDISYASNYQEASLTSTTSTTEEKPFNLTARFDFNWRQPDSSRYSLWARYDYEHDDYECFYWGATEQMDSIGKFHGRFENKENASHQYSVGYRGTTQLSASRWVLHTSADVSLKKKHVADVWLRYRIDASVIDGYTPQDVLGWEMHPDYTDYTINAALHLTDSVYKTPTSRLLLGGGLRFKGEGERFLHDEEQFESDVPDIEVEPVFIEQHATGFRYFFEPFVGGEWLTDKWTLKAEYGLRLYRTSTTDDTGHAVFLYNFADKEHPLSGNTFSHFTPLVAGRAKLTYALSAHHSLSLTNSITDKFPTNQQTVLCFAQTTDYNKVVLGNPHLKPEVKQLFALDHTLTYSPFSATTEASLELTNNQMEGNLYECTLEGRNELALMTQNVARVTTLKLSETLAWKSQWLQTSATVWVHRAHYKGIGSVYGELVNNDNNWGWKLDAKVNFGCGWLLATTFQYTGGYETLISQVSRRWQTSTASIEKKLGPFTLFLNASNLIDPVRQYSQYDANGNMIYLSEHRAGNFLVMLGARWSL